MDIAQRIQPDVLIIEATGVANPSDLKRDLKLSIFQNRFQLREQFCMIDAENFEDAYDTFTSIEKQIESSTVFIINKVDRVDAAVIHKVKRIVAAHHPNPEFYETVYADVPLDKYVPGIIRIENQAAGRPKHVPPQELEAFIDKLLADPRGSMTPPDRLLSVSYTWSGGDRDQLGRMIKMIPDGIVRAKGIFATGSETILFNYVMGHGHIEKIVHKESMNALMNQVVFIGPPEAIENINRIDFGAMMKK